MMVCPYKSLFRLFMISLILVNVLAQDACSIVNSPKAYSDCQPYDNSTAATICCFIRGLYGGNNGTACLSMDILFANRSLSYTLNDLTGTMLCGNSTISSEFITVTIRCLLLSTILLLV